MIGFYPTCAEHSVPLGLAEAACMPICALLPRAASPAGALSAACV